MSSSNARAGRPRARRLVLVAALPVVGGLAAPASAYDLLDLSNHAIALTGRTDIYGPGVNGLGGVTTLGALSMPQINNAGQVVVSGNYTPSAEFAGGSPDGVWRFSPGSGLVVVGRNAAGGAPFGPTRPSFLDGAMLSSDGAVYLRSSNTTPQEGFFRFTSPGTGLVPFALSGTTNATGPGIAGASYSSNTLSAQPNNLLVRGAHAAYEGNLAAGTGGVTFNNDSVLARSTSGGANTVLVREDAATPSPFAANRWFGNQDLGALNASGDAAFLSTYNVGQFGTSVWARYVASTDSVQIIAAAGNSGALGPGGGLSAVFMSGAGSIAMNDAGDVVFMSRIDSGGNPIYLSRRRAGDTANTLLAKGANPHVTSNFQTTLGNGDTMGLPAGRRLNRFESTASPILAGDGSIFVTGTITGGNSSSRALWKHTDSTGFRPILLTDDSTTHASLIGSGVRVDQVHSLAANARGNLAFYGQLFGSGVTTANDLALFVYADDQLSVVVREGQLFDADPSATVVLKTIARIAESSYALTNTGGQDGRRTYFNDNNQLAFTLRFTDGSQGTYVLAIPEPAALSLLTLPGLALARRRR